jgi:hypothetical protein
MKTLFSMPCYAVHLLRNRPAAQPVVPRKGTLVIETLILAFMCSPLRADLLALPQNRRNSLR